MKSIPLAFTCAAFTMASFASLHAQTALNTVRGLTVTNSNSDGVDAYAGSLDQASYNSFASRLESAFDNNTGGTMVTGTWSTGTRSELVANFGQDLSRSISLITTVENFSTVASGSFEPLNSRAFSDQMGNTSTFGFSIGPVIDNNTNSVIAGSGVIEFGFTALSRTAATEYPLDLKVTATFSDATSSSLVSTLGNTKGLSDTFYYFAASEGNFITGITMETFLPGTETLVNSRIAFDNVGFVTSIIPEPHTYALFAGVIGLGLAVMRRRHRS